MEKFQTHKNSTRLFYFWIGIVATFCYRIIAIVNNFDKFWAQTFWYIGTIGFIVYFIHRYQVSEKRAKFIHEYNLNEKVANLQELNAEEKAALKYVIKSGQSKTERWNNIFIFIASGIALLVGFYLDFLRHIL